jgi:hypothetical protein
MGSIDRVQAQASRMESRLTRDQVEGIAWWNGLTEDARKGWCLLSGETGQPEVWAYFKRVAANGTRATPRVVAPGAMFSGAPSAAQHLAWLANWVRMAARAGVKMAEAERQVLIQALDGGLSDVPLSSDLGKRLVPLLTMMSAEMAAREGRVP